MNDRSRLREMKQRPVGVVSSTAPIPAYKRRAMEKEFSYEPPPPEGIDGGAANISVESQLGYFHVKLATLINRANAFGIKLNNFQLKASSFHITLETLLVD